VLQILVFMSDIYNISATIKATFRGEDRLGYKNGETYTIFIVNMSIQRTGGGGSIIYKNLTKFLLDWTNITHSL
jgi:hypothetical protein